MQFDENFHNNPKSWNYMSARQSLGRTFQLHQGWGSEWKHLLLWLQPIIGAAPDVSPQPLSSQDWTNQEVTKYYYEYYYPLDVESERLGWWPPTNLVLVREGVRFYTFKILSKFFFCSVQIITLPGRNHHIQTEGGWEGFKDMTWGKEGVYFDL